MSKESYYQKCINRIYNEGNEIIKYNYNHFFVDGLAMYYKGDRFSVLFKDVDVPLSNNEKKDIFDKVKLEYIKRKDEQDAKILAEL